MVTFDEVGQRILIDRLRSFERLAGFAMPADYAQFLLTWNGGSPTPCDIAIADFPGGETDVRYLFGLDAELSSCDLEKGFLSLREELGPDVLPIGHDSCGGLFCIRARAGDSPHERVGAVSLVLFQFQEAFWYSVAEGFTEFLGMLTDLGDK